LRNGSGKHRTLLGLECKIAAETTGYLSGRAIIQPRKIIAIGLVSFGVAVDAYY